VSARTPVPTLTSRTVVLPTENIDTDQVYPGRFLTVTTSNGLGSRLFADWRYDREGRPRPDFPLNQLKPSAARVLVAGRNFGCGSSREHAVWALCDHGFRAVVSPSFADIFRRNALKNGLLTVTVDAETHARLLANPGAEVTIDLEARELTLPGGPRVAFPIEPFARHCLLAGLDEMEFLLAQQAAIAAYETSPARSPEV
jgi:3-isopropylmalate/(R)-2-methylmalate dehydratase small subunit